MSQLDWAPTANISLHFYQFFISVLVSTYYTKVTLMSGESVAFLFRDDKHAEKEVIEIPQFTITSK